MNSPLSSHGATIECDTLITNGIIVCPNSSGRLILTTQVTPSELIYPPASDIAVKNGKILCIGFLAGIFTAKRIIDAEGGYVTPGGIDSHVHLDQINSIGAVGDKFETGTRSAIAGGTTTIICFALQQKTDDSVLPVIEAYHKKVSQPRSVNLYLC